MYLKRFLSILVPKVYKNRFIKGKKMGNRSGSTPYQGATPCQRVIGVLAITAVMAGCAPLRPSSEVKQLRATLVKPATVTDDQDSANMSLPVETLSDDLFWVKPQASQGNLPNIKVEGLSVNERGLFDVLQIIFSDTPMPLSFEGGIESAARYGVVTLNNLSGPLPEVMDKLGEIMGFFWTVTASGVLRIIPEQQFVITMPPILTEDNMAGMTNTMLYLGGQDVYLDRINRSMVFRANRRALRNIEEYLNRVRESRTLIVYDMNVLQVDLNDSKAMGIRWELLKVARGLNAARDSDLVGPSTLPIEKLGQVTRTPTGIDALIFGRDFQTNILLDFLRSQGDVKTLSQPKIGIMNGTNGMIRVGQSTTFVSRVGSQIVNGVAQSTADTQNLRTGLELSLTGEVHENTVYSRIGISITELLALKRFTALGVDLNLPEVADRELKTQVRCRPGDTIILGGITVSRSQDDFAFGAGVNSRNESTKQTELVVTIRPRILSFKKPGEISVQNAERAVMLGKNAAPKVAEPKIEEAVEASVQPVPVKEMASQQVTPKPNLSQPSATHATETKEVGFFQSLIDKTPFRSRPLRRIEPVPTDTNPIKAAAVDAGPFPTQKGIEP